MSWYEINIKTSEAAIDAVTNLLYGYGATGVMINNPNDEDFTNQELGKWDYYDPQNLKLDFEGVLITGYFDDCNIEEVAINLKESIDNLTDFNIPIGLNEVTHKAIYASDWENEWKKYFKPFRLGNHIVIKPSWETFETKDEDLVIEIDPGNAFGSGTHETTSMCIEMIEKYMKPSDTVIDVGCGSGILAIAAGKLGAKEVIAVDIDENAVLTARENLKLNGLEEISDVRHGDLIKVVPEKAELVVANIIADIIVKFSDDVESIMKADALFVSSGLILDKVDWVIEELMKRQFEIVEVMKKGEWAVVVSRKVKG
ncbi:MAG: ribosomal protein L11 methyltransferase [Clostridiales bacterium 38-18]|nr:MAG: ribosomal protein L11 methyltransferase [Clostridiales bacterium 38-18]